MPMTITVTKDFILGRSLKIKGIDIKKASRFPNMVISKGEPSCSIFNAIVVTDKVKPHKMASRFPIILPVLKSFTKKSPMPRKTEAIAKESYHLIFSFKTHTLNIATNMGEVYCSKITLAEVVSLFAIIKLNTVTVLAREPNI